MVDEFEIELIDEEGPSRNSLQKIALFSLYDVLTYKNLNMPVDVEHIISSLCGQEYKDCPYFAKAIVIMAIKNFDAEVRDISSYLKRWTFDRLNIIAQAILLLAYTHFYYVEPEIDKGIVINVAVKFAKVYLDSNDYKFINAVLDNCLNRKSTDA